ncbi:hypothetical protein JCM17960_19950 [Magnetospira thiophila]
MNHRLSVTCVVLALLTGACATKTITVRETHEDDYGEIYTTETVTTETTLDANAAQNITLLGAVLAALAVAYGN